MFSELIAAVLAAPILTVATLVVLIGMITMTELEQFGWATVLCCIVAAACQFFGLVNIISFFRNHTGEAILFLAAYLATGVLWSIFKWWTKVLRARDQWREFKALFVQRYNNRSSDNKVPGIDQIYIYEPIPLALMPELTFNSDLPTAAHYKSTITAWIAYWPFSVVGTLLNDPIRRAVEFLFARLKLTYQKISDQVFSSEAEFRYSEKDRASAWKDHEVRETERRNKRIREEEEKARHNRSFTNY